MARVYRCVLQAGRAETLQETSRRLQMAQTEADSAEAFLGVLGPGSSRNSCKIQDFGQAAYKKMQKAADHAVDRKAS